MHERHPNSQPLTDAAIQPPVRDVAGDPQPDLANPRHREALEKLEQGYEAATTSEGFQAYLKVVARLWRYSPRNQLLIFSQMPDASVVASYDRWKALGRRVRKGERGIKIFFPYRRKVEWPPDEEGNTDEYAVTGFGLGTVFDVSQTDGEPLPPRPTPSERFGTTEVAKLLDRRASLWGIGRGITMEKVRTYPSRGNFDPVTKTLQLSEDLADNDGKFKTLVHELAHYAAGHRPGWEDKPRKEVEAEGTAYATLLALGLDVGGYSFRYMALHGKSPAMMREALPTIARTTRILVEAIEGERPDGEGAWL